ncbi:choice-of-anchor O protein [Burkholderiaceae bacterium FT117]|uniref:choice-of-anchor O protein n=1 Tax=Zeimonas sediminis TaxID=2944268 RepID=UPI002342F810|nr:choice-of-anchor O protein [Zeimonas sediminis]MCM5570147.1 choice-of-anchor O protein [Zeimonas sediminis]
MLAGLAAVAGLAYAATQITVGTPIALSSGGNGDKPKIQRTGDGTLVVAYGDSPEGAGLVYDVKAQVERVARDIFVRTCKPSADKTCDNVADWSAAVNISNSALKSSISTEWRGTLEPGLMAYPGDIDKPNIKTSGPVMVLTWVSKYCPDGDISTRDVDDTPVQRAVRYLTRDNRVIPFSCVWLSYSTNNGGKWSQPLQMNTGIRDAIQDSSGGGFNTETRKGQVVVTWQEDPHGLLLGEGDGPGDGASGANVNGGTDVWYTFAPVDLTVAGTPLTFASPIRVTDNWQGQYGPSSSMEAETEVVDATGALVDPSLIETGVVGASRPNNGLVGSTAIIGYEEGKGASDSSVKGKLVRFHAFPYSKPEKTTIDVGGAPQEIGTPGCVLSDPARNARRVRFLTQGPTDAGAGGIQLAVFWREGVANKGGAADIVLRRGIDGVQPANMVPTVDPNCATSDFASVALLASQRAENVSGSTPTATEANLLEDTEANNAENALAHRGVLRGGELWLGYMYASDLAKLAVQQDNYNFWLRKYTLGVGWESPRNVTNISDTAINVREPRIFGTPKSSVTACPSGDPADPTTTDATLCQNTSIVYLAWGTQTNTADPEDLGVWITVSTDAGANFNQPVRYSTAMGSLFQDDEAAYESQVVTRPDGTRFYGVWNQADLVAKTTAAEYASGDLITVPDPVVPPADGGCTMSTGKAPFDPSLLLLAALGLGGIALRRVRRQG